MSPTFAALAAPVPDLDALAARTDELVAALGPDATTDACLGVIHEWDGLRRRVADHRALVDLRFQQHTDDPVARAEREAWGDAAPRWTELTTRVKRALLAHPRRAELERTLGGQVFALWATEVLAFDPVIADGLVTESRLSSEYVRLQASATVTLDGERLNLPALVGYRQHDDRDLRHRAERAFWGWFEQNSGELDQVYDDLVRERTGMARALGLDDFVELGYRRMCRVDYDRGDVERLRAAVREHVVPFAAELRARQATALGLEHVYAWDEQVHDPAGSPVPGGDAEWLTARAREVFDGMGPLGPFFRTMDTGGFLDLPARDGKAGGGFCTSFPTTGMPFVFANFNGTTSDLKVFTHEMGHAFQCWSSREQPLSDYHWPTLESAEIHSMSLEFLTGPHLERFFGDGAHSAERYRRAHLTDAVLFLPYGCLVDHFQHEVYSRPELSPAERHEVWWELERAYLPWRDWGDLEYPASGASWQRQRHIYGMPFYYIDYVLAQLCALQFRARAQADPAAALDDYVALCGRGGSAPFRELAASAGLRSPFDPGCVADVIDVARAALA